MTTRVASHAGSWYSNNGAELDKQLTKWLQAVPPSPDLMPSRAVIAPHAGYSYCGETAAYAYRHLDPSRIKRIFVLGPSHHVYLTGAAITGHGAYATPLGPLLVDAAVNQELVASGLVERMTEEEDAEEHSLEMQMPFIAKAMQGCKHAFTIVPLMVGNLSPEKESVYGRLMGRYLADPANFFVISSDFCHWGQRFRYLHYDPAHGEIYQSIEQVDREGMAAIETLSAAAYHKYQALYKNTICGRHAIAVLLHAVAHDAAARGASGGYALRFLDYSQSSQCRSKHHSSVSYAAAVLRDAAAA